jgi:hypothetical protein
MKINEMHALNKMVKQMARDPLAVESVVMSVLYSDGIIDTFSFGGDNSGERLEIKPISNKPL